MKAKTFLWGAFPPTLMNRNGSTRSWVKAPIPRGTEIPEDCLCYAPTPELLEEEVAKLYASAAKKRGKGHDARTKQLFGGEAA